MVVLSTDPPPPSLRPAAGLSKRGRGGPSVARWMDGQIHPSGTGGERPEEVISHLFLSSGCPHKHVHAHTLKHTHTERVAGCQLPSCPISPYFAVFWTSEPVRTEGRPASRRERRKEAWRRSRHGAAVLQRSRLDTRHLELDSPVDVLDMEACLTHNTSLVWLVTF